MSLTTIQSDVIPSKDLDLLAELGKGRFSTVYLGTFQGRNVAIKSLSDRKELENERTILLTLRYLGECIHLALYIGYDPFLKFIALEYVEGDNLEAYKASQPKGSITPEFALNMIQQVSAAFAFMHENSDGKIIFHRDIKLDNLMMSSESGIIKVVDFGLAVILADPSQECEIAGTPLYFSSETAFGVAKEEPLPMSLSADWWALGVSAFCLLTGAYPFKSKDGSIGSLLTSILINRPPYEVQKATLLKYVQKHHPDNPETGRVTDIVCQLLHPMLSERITSYSKLTAALQSQLD